MSCVILILTLFTPSACILVCFSTFSTNIRVFNSSTVMIASIFIVCISIISCFVSLYFAITSYSCACHWSCYIVYKPQLSIVDNVPSDCIDVSIPANSLISICSCIFLCSISIMSLPRLFYLSIFITPISINSIPIITSFLRDSKPITSFIYCSAFLILIWIIAIDTQFTI